MLLAQLLLVGVKGKEAIVVKDGVGESFYPFAKNRKVACVAELQLLQYMKMAIYEVRDFWMLSKITYGEFLELVEQRMPFLPGLAPGLTAVMTPTVGKWDCPSRVYGRIEKLANLRPEH